MVGLCARRHAAIIVHHHHALLCRPCKMRFFNIAGGNDNPADAMGKHIVQKSFFFFNLPVGITNQHPVLILFGGQIDFTGQRGKTGIHNGRHQQANHFRLSGLELLRHPIWKIIQRLHALLDTRQRFSPHLIGTTVEHIGYRTDGNASMLCDITNIRHTSPLQQSMNGGRLSFPASPSS